MALTTPDHVNVADLVERLWQQRRPSVVARVEALVAAVGVLGLETNVCDIDQIEREAHRLVGTVGTFGFLAAAEHARRIELAVASGAFRRQEDRLDLTAWATALRSELDLTPERSRSVGSAATTSLTIGIVTADSMLMERLRLEAADRDIVLERQVAGLPRQTEWSAVVVDLDEFGELSDLVADRGSDNTILVLLASDELDQRLRAEQLLPAATVSRNSEPDVIIDVIIESIRGKAVAGRTVLALDDDTALLSDLACILGHAGLDAQTVSDPEELWTALQRRRPDLVMLDIDMPGVDGIALCKVLRSDLRLRSVPVMFLTARTDSATVDAGFAAGADDFVAKPIVGPELVTRIVNRLERVDRFRQLADLDQLTGVPNRRGSEQVIEELLADITTPAAFVIVDLDHFKSVNDRFGHPAGDEVLRTFGALARRSIRAGDIVSRWGGEEFVFVLTGVSRAEAVGRFDQLLLDTADHQFTAPDGTSYSVTFSAGVAMFPDDAGNVRQAHRVADEKLYQAKAAGRARIQP